MRDRPRQGHDTDTSELSFNDQQCLWWLLEQHLWTCGDLVRFGSYTNVLSDVDRTVLLSYIHQCETIVKSERKHHALSKKAKGSLLQPQDGEAESVGEE